MKSPIDLTLIGSDEDSRPRSSKRAKKGDNRTMRPSCGSVISIGSDSEIKEPRRRRRTARKSSLDVIEDKSDDEPMAAGPLPSLPRPHPTVSNTTSIALKSLLMGTSHGHASSIQIAASKDGIRKGEVDPCKDRGRQKGRTCVLPNASGDEGFSLIDEVDQVIREDNHHGKSGRRRSSRLQALPPRPSRIDQNGEDLGVYHFSPNRDEVEGHDKSFMIGSEESGSGVKRKKPSRSGLSSPFSFSNIDCANKEDDSLLPSPTAAPAAKAKRGQRKTEEEKQAEAEVKSRMREEKKKAKEKEREEKKKAAEAEKIEKKAMALTQKALRGRDGEARIRVKFSTKAAVCNWYGAALSSINTILSLPSTATSVCEIPLHPPLALGSELSIVTWSRMMPQAAAQVLMARGGSGGGAKEGEGRQGGSGGVNGVKNVAEIEVMVPLVLVVMTPEDLVAQVEKDKLEGIMERMASHYPECSLLLACCGLDPYLAKKQAKTPGFNIKLIEELILDLVVAPSCSALHLRTDLKDEAHLASFIGKETRVIARDLQKGNDGFLSCFSRKGDGLDHMLPRGEYDEATRTFAKALTQNCLLPLDKAAAVAVRFKSLGGLLDAYDDPVKTERQKREMLMGSNMSGTKNLGVASSTAVYDLLSKKKADELVQRAS